MARPLLLGHRGCRISRPGAPAENTLAAFDLCMEAGCDGFEFDVRLTSDRRLVICHDPRLRGKLVSRNSYQQLSLYAGPSPCLEDVLAHYGSAFLDIELKVTGAEEAVGHALRANPPRGEFVISSFLPDVLTRLHIIDSTLPLGHIFDRVREAQLWKNLPVSYVMPNHRLVTRESVREFHDASKKVMAWTVNAREDMKRLADWGVDAIVSDDPVLLCGVFGGSGG